MKDIINIVEKYGISSYKSINPSQIYLGQWVRFKCMFGCNSYGKKYSCPPHNLSLEDCQMFVNEYENILLLHFKNSFSVPEKRFAWTKSINKMLLQLERDIFISNYPRVFVTFIDECTNCTDCVDNKMDCKNKKNVRPTLESICIDVYKTVQNAGFPIKVLKKYNELMNRYCLLFIQ